MKINEKDIVRIAHELRDEENKQLNVRPWNRHRHVRFPAWLAAIPAAAIIGFVLGGWTNSQIQSEQPLTAFVDTVYVTVKEKSPKPDTIESISKPLPPQPTYRQVQNGKVKKTKRETHIGQPVINDNIRYDLLVSN